MEAAEPANEWEETRGGPVAFRKKRGDSAKKGALEFNALLNPEPAAPIDDRKEAKPSASLSASEGENDKLVGVKAFDFLAVGNVEASVASGLHADLNERLFGDVTSTTELAGGSATSTLHSQPFPVRTNNSGRAPQKSSIPLSTVFLFRWPPPAVVMEPPRAQISIK